MIRKGCRRIALGGLLLLSIAGMLSGHVEAAGRITEKTIYNSPYVSFSPDGKAFTTCAGDRNYKWYDRNNSTTVYTGIPASLRNLQRGEHYYRYERTGEIPVGSWKVVHRRGQCVHDGYPDRDWHGIVFGKQKCRGYYYSGWRALCADCGEEIEPFSIYMSKEAAESIQYLDLGREDEPVSYYYLCPFCRNLEQGVTFSPHQCKEISWNQYSIYYDSNADKGEISGTMPVSYHMYNNVTVYEGQTVTPVTHLTQNNYTRNGYVFVGWNTEPDGSGTSYEDKAEVWNLSNADWKDPTTWEEADKGRVTLYAQWQKSVSTLLIQAGDGKYDGRDSFSLTLPYASQYVIQKKLVQPPESGVVSFETNGGTQIEPVAGTSHFVEWKRCYPFLGRLTEDTYLFLAPDGNTDTVEAVYAPDPIILPETAREGWSFGGWYYDPEFTLPAGGSGDRIVSSEDITLYAQWVELRLQSYDNYTVNNGEGAVDLTWSQSDQSDKTYLVYQKKEDGAWIKVNSANDISNAATIDDDYIYEGKQKKYVVPYTGSYRISAMGAQGKNYSSYHGGYGGSVTATFWLKEGEILTCVAGGQNGYNGGGSASAFGNGGGMTTVVSDQKGILLIAGGGGGAYSRGHGGDGGSSASVIAGHNGQAGMAGGGAGYQGGTAGMDTPEVKELRFRHFRDVGLANTWQAVTAHGTKSYGPVRASSVGGYLYGIDQSGNGRFYQTNGKWQENTAADSYVMINGEKWWPMNGWRIAVTSAMGNSVRAYLTGTGLGQSWVGFEDPCCNGQTEFVQGYWAVVQPAGNVPSYGGSNYINTSHAQWYEGRSGVQSGDGMIHIQSQAIGYQDTVELEGVTAKDQAAPAPISEKVTREVLDGRNIRVVWTEPEDRGTDYYHKVESYLRGSTSMLCSSNITKNTLISGVKGYYYLLDREESTVVTDTADYLQEPQVEITMLDVVQYLHVAAVDVAGNVGETTHIRIEQGDVLWKLYTRQLEIEEKEENVFLKTDKTWYVRADGKTPFTLRISSYMDGIARADYQPNELIYETIQENGETAQNKIYTPSSAIIDGILRTEASGLTYATEGKTVLEQYPYSYTVRSDRNKELAGVQKFVLRREYSGQTIQVIPAAAAYRGADRITSDHTQDERNKITLIADGEAPVIHGMEILEKQEIIDRRDGDITICARAEDGISGVRKFYIVISNTDNAISRTYTPGEDGCITITITRDDPIFSGDFTVLGYAVDHVGNENTLLYGTTEFALESSVERTLEPQEPVFKCGESGILTFTTWGYADRVEVIFPESMTRLDPELNRNYDYKDTPGYKITEQLSFMVPLYMPENQELEITVRAYKGDKKLEEHPTISVIGVSGTVLDELRTRLR